MRLILKYCLLLGCIGILVAPTFAQRPDAPPYAEPGTYAVGTQNFTIPDEARPLTGTLWYPAQGTPGEEPTVTHNIALALGVPGRGTRDAEPFRENAPYPLVIFSHGSGGSRAISLFLTEHLAARGYVVMAVDHPGNNIRQSLVGEQNFVDNYAERPRDIIRQIDYAADTLNAEDGTLAGIIDTDNVGLIGHSFGGWTVLSAAGGRIDFGGLNEFCASTDDPDENICFLEPLEREISAARGYDTPPEGTWDALTDERIQAVVAYAPWNAPLLDLEEVEVPTLIIVGTSDTVTPPERDAYPMYDALPAPKSLMRFLYAGHTIYIDECPPVFETFGEFESCSDKVWDLPRAHDLINHTTTLFFEMHLNANDTAADAFTPEALDFRATEFEQALP